MSAETRSSKATELRFVADGMLGRIARWLRLLGYDIAYDMNPTDEELMRIGSVGSRTLLTSDVHLYRRAVGRGLNAYLLKTSDSQAVRLAKLARRFGIRLEVNVKDCRCPLCNSLLREADKTEIGGRVPPTSLDLYREFWICTNNKCGKVYWQGSHWRKISNLLNEASQILSTMSNEGDHNA